MHALSLASQCKVLNCSLEFTEPLALFIASNDFVFYSNHVIHLKVSSDFSYCSVQLLFNDKCKSISYNVTNE